LLPQSTGAVLRKDLLMMRRDLRNMSQLITPMIFGIIYGIFLLKPGGVTSQIPTDTPSFLVPIIKNGMLYANVALSMFISWSMLSRLALMSFSQEGKNYWMIKIAPVRPGRLILAKFLSAYLPALIIGWIFLLIISLIQGAGLPVAAFGLAVVAFTLAGTAGINLMFGITAANLVWEDPRRMNTGWTGCLSMLIGFAYVLTSLGLFFAPPLILSSLGLPEVLGQAAGLLLGGAISLACAILPPYLVAGRVARIGDGQV
jgi:ABC-2 type transport system permease protein